MTENPNENQPMTKEQLEEALTPKPETNEDQPAQEEQLPTEELTEEEKLLQASAELEAATVAMSIDFENLKPNSVLVIKMPAQNPMYHARLRAAIVQGILQPRMELLKEKKLGVLFMTTDDSIELLSEEDMNKAGWVKKEPSLIIKPGESGGTLPPQ